VNSTSTKGGKSTNSSLCLNTEMLPALTISFDKLFQISLPCALYFPSFFQCESIHPIDHSHFISIQLHFTVHENTVVSVLYSRHSEYIFYTSYLETLEWSKQHVQIKTALFWDLVRVACIKWCFEWQKFICKQTSARLLYKVYIVD